MAHHLVVVTAAVAVAAAVVVVVTVVVAAYRNTKCTSSDVTILPTTLPQTKSSTVPLNRVHNHRPSGTYSLMIGRLASCASAHSFNRSNRSDFHPGLDGAPAPLIKGEDMHVMILIM